MISEVIFCLLSTFFAQIGLDNEVLIVLSSFSLFFFFCFLGFFFFFFFFVFWVFFFFFFFFLAGYQQLIGRKKWPDGNIKAKDTRTQGIVAITLKIFSRL